MSKKQYTLLGAVAISTLACSASLAQDRATNEIIVTAQKREQSIQKIGIAVTAVGKQGLATLGRQDIAALVTQVPGLQVQEYAPTVTIFNIRGVSQNDFSDSQEAPIAFYNDGVYISSLGAISGQTYDLQRIEVLRGPQGTLFGRNATGGLIQMITAAPTSKLEGFITGTAGSYGQFATEGAISGPLSDDLRGRLSFTTNNGGDFVKNDIGRSLGGAKFYAGRAQLAADLGSVGRLKLKAELIRNDHDRQAGLYAHVTAIPNGQGLGSYVEPTSNPFGTCPGCDSQGYKDTDGNPYRISNDGPHEFNRTWWSVTGQYEKDFGGATLTSVSNYQHLKKSYAEDADASPLDLFNYYTRQNLFQASEELRLAGKTDRLRWILGLYGIVIHTKNGYIADLTGAFGARFDYRSLLDTDSLAGFGQLEYDLTDQLTVIGGIRYSEDWKIYDFYHATNGTQDFAFNHDLFPALAHKHYGNYSGKIELDYKPNNDVLVYATVNRGTKSGGFNTRPFAPFVPDLFPFKQEVLTNWEGGIKFTLFNGTSHLNAAGFYYQYHNYQSFELTDLATLVRNKNAHLKGLEIVFDTRLLRGLDLQAYVTALGTKVFDVTIPDGQVLDRKMPEAPKLSVGGSARYEFVVGPGKAAAQTNWKYDSHQYFTTFNAPVDREPGRLIGDVRVSYQPDRLPVEVAFFVNNVTDKHYLLKNSDFSDTFGFTAQSLAKPRWFGGSITYRFQ